jgi:hypothetical protein
MYSSSIKALDSLIRNKCFWSYPQKNKSAAKFGRLFNAKLALLHFKC